MAAPPYRTLGLTVPVTDALDPQLWRERYAYGIVLGPGEKPAESQALQTLLGCKSKKGQPKTAGARAITTPDEAIACLASEIPLKVIRWHLRAAASQFELMSGMPLGVVTVVSDPVDAGLVQGVDYDLREPRRPYTAANQRDYYRIDLPGPVLSIERIRAYFFDQLVWSIAPDENNMDMVLLEHPAQGSVHILPNQNATILVTAPQLAAPYYGPFRLMGELPSPLPGVWAVDYTMGPRTSWGTPGEIPAAVAHWIYCKAGIMLMSIGGMSASKGLTNASLSIDGLSKSIGLQASAMYGINSALENRMKEATESLDIDRLKLQLKGLRVLKYRA